MAFECKRCHALQSIASGTSLGKSCCPPFLLICKVCIEGRWIKATFLNDGRMQICKVRVEMSISLQAMFICICVCVFACVIWSLILVCFNTFSLGTNMRFVYRCIHWKRCASMDVINLNLDVIAQSDIANFLSDLCKEMKFHNDV